MKQLYTMLRHFGVPCHLLEGKEYYIRTAVSRDADAEYIFYNNEKREWVIKQRRKIIGKYPTTARFSVVTFIKQLRLLT